MSLSVPVSFLSVTVVDNCKGLDMPSLLTLILSFILSLRETHFDQNFVISYTVVLLTKSRLPF